MAPNFSTNQMKKKQNSAMHSLIAHYTQMKIAIENVHTRHLRTKESNKPNRYLQFVVSLGQLNLT